MFVSSLWNLFLKFSLSFQDTSLPTAVFVWDIQNDGSSDLEASITFTFKNGQGVKADSAGGCWSEPFQHQHKSEDDAGSASDKGVVTHGVSIHQIISGQPCSYNIAASVKVCAIFSSVHIADDYSTGVQLIWLRILQKKMVMVHWFKSPVWSKKVNRVRLNNCWWSCNENKLRIQLARKTVS